MTQISKPHATPQKRSTSKTSSALRYIRSIFKLCLQDTPDAVLETTQYSNDLRSPSPHRIKDTQTKSTPNKPPNTAGLDQEIIPIGSRLFDSVEYTESRKAGLIGDKVLTALVKGLRTDKSNAAEGCLKKLCSEEFTKDRNENWIKDEVLADLVEAVISDESLNFKYCFENLCSKNFIQFMSHYKNNQKLSNALARTITLGSSPHYFPLAYTTNGFSQNYDSTSEIVTKLLLDD